MLAALWQRGNATVRELLADGSVTLAYTTVMTTLDRLYKKRLLDRVPEGRAFRYSPSQTREELERGWRNRAQHCRGARPAVRKVKRFSLLHD